MKKDGNEYTMKELIDAFAQKHHLTTQMFRDKIINSWKIIAGQAVFVHTKKVDVIGNKLYIEIDDPALRNELLFMKEKIINAVNRYLETEFIKDVVIK